jgi:N-acetylneuraminate synthase/N,N'-diacetyllegionaminate synthase
MEGIDASILALSLKIDYIEKHFTTDKFLPGRDNKFAIMPRELKQLKHFTDLSYEISQDRGIDYQPCESEARKVYSGRWNG